MDEPKIVNRMADGTANENLAAYLQRHTLPETAWRVREEVVCGGTYAEHTEKGTG